MKQITIAGNVTKDCVMRTTQGGQKVLGFSIAVNGYEGGQKAPYFFDVSIWGKRGEAAERFAIKGAKLCVTGDLSTREHNGKMYLQISASDFTPMGGSPEQRGGACDNDPGRQAPAPSRDLEDSIPF